MRRRARLLVFIVAYRAEDTLEWVLGRIPRSIFDEYDTHVLVVDDGSEDRTCEIGRAYQRAHPEMGMTVLRNAYNQGYGGNQKVGYAFAIEEGFDFVALVHGDGQYAPEELPRMVAPLHDGEADAVFGSRMMTRFGALKGGMPLYKFVGNRILTVLQNMLLGTNLTEFHSGYRAYSVETLKRLPLQINSNDFHFDTEIIIQLLNAKQRIVELPIPTYYGDEISRVNGLRYARNVLSATLHNVAHRAGLLYQRRFDTAGLDGHTHYELKLGYASSHQFAADAVAPGARVVDLRVGPIGIDEVLRRKGCSVTIVEQDLGLEPVVDVQGCDYLLMLDVIEHLLDPEQFLDRLRTRFDYSPRTLVLTTPNVAFVVPRLMLALGQFNYGKAGILDRTHTRLFTLGSLRRLLNDTGFRIKEIRGVPAPFPRALGHGTLARTALAVNQFLIRVSLSLFAYQIFVVAESTPSVAFVLRDSKARSVRD